MAEPKCALKESLEVKARNAVAYEKGLETTFLIRRHEQMLLRASNWRV